MKKISEMTLEELQDYALDLEGKNVALTEERTTRQKEYDDLSALNRQLQKRNNDLLMRIEQPAPTPDPVPDKPPVETCEDFARKFVLGE